MLRRAEFDAGLFPSVDGLKLRAGRGARDPAVKRLAKVWQTAGWVEQPPPPGPPAGPAGRADPGRLVFVHDEGLRERRRRQQPSEAERCCRRRRLALGGEPGPG